MRGQKNKVLVTGADGFIGSHLVERLLSEGYSVRAFIFYNALGRRGWLDDITKKASQRLEIRAGDIRDGECVRRAVKGCATVMHLAALIGIPDGRSGTVPSQETIGPFPVSRFLIHPFLNT